MKSLGARATGLRLERMQASPSWVRQDKGGGFRNLAPIRPGLRDPAAKMPSLERLSVRRHAPRPHGAAAGGRSARGLAEAACQRPARHLARPLHRADRDRRPARAHRPGLGPARFALAARRAKRFQPVPVALDGLPPIDAVLVSHDHYDHLRYPTIRALRQDRRALRHLARRRRAPRGLGRAPERITELDWWESHRLPGTELERDRRAFAAFLRARPEGPQQHLVVVAGDALAAPSRLLQRRHRPHRPSTRRFASASAPSIW